MKIYKITEASSKNIKWRTRRTMKDRISLGDTVKDTYSGFTGVVTAWCEYLYSSSSLCISGAKDGVPHDEWLPEIRVKKIEKKD